ATYRIARTVFNEVALRCDYFLDCHGSDIGEDQFPNVIVPAAGDPDTDAKAEAMARAVGTEFIRRLDLTTPDATRGTFAGEVIRRGIPAMITEIGGHGRYTEEEIDLQNRAAVNVLRHVGVLKGDPEPLEAFSEQKIFNWPAQSYRVVTGVGGSYHRRVGPRSPVKRGDLLAEIKDEWGEVIESFYSQHDAVVRLVNPWRIVKPGDSLMNLFRLEG
ncbi:MAG: succinylglutamate desuccinylase/aspartoacylase family protein, partial [Thermaerobacterales bacterium]